MIAQTQNAQNQNPDLEAIKGRQRQTWVSGDFDRIAATITITGDLLCEAVDVHPAQKVLDVASGSGNTAIAAIPQPPEYAAVRAKFETMTPEQWKAAGYTRECWECGRCDPGIGVRFFNDPLWIAQLQNGPDPQNPPILLADRNRQRVLGLHWVTYADTQSPPELFGQQMLLVSLGGEPRYALFSFFKPNGYVLFARSDPDDPCRR